MKRIYSIFSIIFILAGFIIIENFYSVIYAQTKQGVLRILTNSQSVQFSGTSKKVKIKISNIGVVASFKGDTTDTTKSHIKLKVTDFNVNINGFTAASKPLVEEDNGKFSIILEIAGELDRGEELVHGEASCFLTAVAINANNEELSSKKVKLSIPINYEPEPPFRKSGRKR